MPPKRSKPSAAPPAATTTGGLAVPQVDGAGDEDAAAAPKVWVCGACTFQNKLGSSKCQVCATPKGTSSRKNIHRRAAESEQQAELRRLEQQKRRAAMAEKRRKELEQQADEHGKLQTQIQKAREADSKSVTPASSSSRAKPAAASPEADKEGEDERGSKRKGGVGPGSRGGPGARIVSGMLKRLKAKDTTKTDITINTATVSIWASKMVGPEFGFNIVSEST